ncbi:MAG: hypothetical protein K6G54_08750 [Oscillospiraceae bacterium]|nr:hypothetical protein [Oscillospiraceae bacterium]
MRFYQKIDGGVHVSAREYDVAADAALSEGQVVRLSEGRVMPALAGQSTAVLGVAAESHSGSADALNPRANGTKVLVMDDPAAVYCCAAPQITAVGGSETTLVFAEGRSFSADDFNGGFVRLLRKGAGSTNGDAVGTLRAVSDFAVTPGESGTLTLERGGAPNAGDVYALFPPVGFAKGNLNDGRDGIVLTASSNLALRVVGRDETSNSICVMAKKHVFAVEA